MKTSEPNAPDGFALTWQHLREPHATIFITDIFKNKFIRKQMYTIAQRPRKASSFSISSRILHKLIDNDKHEGL
jgi:hypothetical protein